MIWTVEAQLSATMDPNAKRMRGALHAAALAVSVIAAHGVIDEEQSVNMHVEPLQPGTSAVLRAARMAAIDSEAPLAAARLAALLREMGLDRQAGELLEAYQGHAHGA